MRGEIGRNTKRELGGRRRKAALQKKLELKRDADVMDKMMLAPSRNLLQYFSNNFSM